MKIELPKNYDIQSTEAKWRAYWNEHRTYAFAFDPSRPTYVVDTPPPYVSADHLHSGHIMSFSQAEFIVRYKRMRGYNVFYPMGFDDNGLPTERFVEKKYNIDKSKTSKKEFVDLCLAETAKGAQTYKKLWDGIGLSVDWDMTYSTINPTATRVSQGSLVDLYKKGHLYRKEMPILWCTFCQTALAQADLEDMEAESHMHTIIFKGEDGQDLHIATTRPELLPGCVALYVNPEDGRYTNLIGKKAKVPLFDLEVTVHTSDAVALDKGTGLMMVCTWGDAEDVEKWQNDTLDTRQVFTADGKLNELAGKYQGMTIESARAAIIEDLQTAGLLVKSDPITHTKNVHERCSTPANFLASKQWFIKIADQKDIWRAQGEKLNWFPAHFKHEYDMWVDGLKWDWCISRQRFFGVPLPIWYCASCETPVFADEAQLPVEPTIDKPPVDTCTACGHGEFIPERDVMDTWATSSCTPFLLRELVKDTEQKTALFPTSLRPNAHEIIRTWDFYSVVKAYYNFGDIPFKDVMISGHGLDEQGRKISKRLGNFKPSDDLLAEFGADAIRYWATGANLGENLRFQPKEIEVGKKTINKLWNVAKLLTMHMEEYEPGVAMAEMEYADAWILSRLRSTVERVSASMDVYEFAHARMALAEFFWSDLADRYIEFIKYRLWNDDGKVKMRAVDTLYQVFDTVLRLYAPFMPFITEELYNSMYAKDGESIHLAAWPTVDVPELLDIADFDTALAAIDEIRKYKSDNQLSLGAELETYTLMQSLDTGKYGELVARVMRVQNLSVK